MHFLNIEIYNSKNEPINNASILASDLTAPNYFSTDSLGFAQIPLLTKMTEITVSHSKYVTPKLIYKIPYSNQKIDTLIVELNLNEKQLLFFNFEDIGSSEVSQPEELKYYSTDEIQKLTDQNKDKEFSLIENVNIDNEIIRVSELLSYNSVNDLEKILVGRSGSILYPILCYHNKAIVTVNGGCWSKTYLVIIEESKVKYQVISSWIS